ncbi:MAG: alkanesulfonate monooxygenase [Paenibacillus sp.]|jgi:FMNH2-dependent dimethyl sulfone monooxygenase|nr:alkanesulfonate monooxygenase [Paenibacillus sp.]
MSLQFALWGSNIAGGFLRSNIDQSADSSYTFNLEYTRLADRLGYDAMLFPTRYIGGLGGTEAAGGQLDSLAIIGALAGETKHIHLISAVLPSFVHPVTLAKVGATLDQISGGRWHVNLVSGWFKKENDMFGIEWLDHSERYKRSEEYLQVLKGLWQQGELTFRGNYYPIEDGRMTPLPVQKPYPSIFQGGNSEEAQEMAGKYSDWYFMNGGTHEELEPQMDRIREIAARHNRSVRFAVNAFVIARETEEEAQQELQTIIDHADPGIIEKFRANVQEAKGMWSRATSISDYIAISEGFRTGLIGSYEQVADKIQELNSIGIEMILIAFRYPLTEAELFYIHVAKQVNHQSQARGKQ